MTQACAKSELIVGGQKSCKSARAEQLAAAWLPASPDHEAMLIATGSNAASACLPCKRWKNQGAWQKC